LYDEQIRDFIHQVGIDKVSKRLVNSADAPPEFAKPDFSLPRLVEFGNQMVQEQQRIHTTRLTEEYLSRALREPAPTQSPKPSGRRRVETAIAVDPWNNQPDPSVEVPPLPSLNGSTTLGAESLKHLHRLLINGYRIGIEHVDQRRFRTNSWQCYAIVQGGEQAAISTLESCLNDHPSDYVRLVGIDPQARRRISEVIIQRPE